MILEYLAAVLLRLNPLREPVIKIAEIRAGSCARLSALAYLTVSQGWPRKKNARSPRHNRLRNVSRYEIG